MPNPSRAAVPILMPRVVNVCRHVNTIQMPLRNHAHKSYCLQRHIYFHSSKAICESDLPSVLYALTALLRLEPAGVTAGVVRREFASLSLPGQKYCGPLLLKRCSGVSSLVSTSLKYDLMFWRPIVIFDLV